MSIYLRISLGIVVIAYFWCIIYLIKKKMLLLKYILLWLFTGIVMGILILFPQLLNLFVQVVGIQTPMFGLFLVGIFFSLLISMSLTAIVSRQTERIKNLTQNNAMLEKRIRKIEEEKFEN